MTTKEEKKNPTVPAQPPTSATFSSITEKFADRLMKAGPVIAEKIVDALTDIELKRRTDLVTKAFELLTSLKEELGKIKPDRFDFDEDGVMTKKSFSPETNSKRQKLKNRMRNLEGAIDQAVSEQSNFKRLDEVLKSGGEDIKKEDSSSS